MSPAPAPEHQHRVDPAKAVASERRSAPGSMRADHADVLDLQRRVGNQAVVQLIDAHGSDEPGHDREDPSAGVRRVIGSGGQPLDDPVRRQMERSLGASFDDVRVHHDQDATRSAQSVQAHAYTVGNHVVFQRDAYAPQSAAGMRMLAHELTHVVQQRSGPVEGTPVGSSGMKVSDPSDRFEREAESTAASVVSDEALTER